MADKITQSDRLRAGNAAARSQARARKKRGHEPQERKHMMKKVVQGVLCDTETAKVLGEYEHDCKSLLHWYVERLYRTKSGKYFIHGEGHAASPYAKKVAQSEWAPGEAVKLLPPEAARQWAEDHLDAGEYIAAFGEPDEDGEPVVLTIDSATKRRLDRLKETTGKSIKQLVAEAVMLCSGEE